MFELATAGNLASGAEHAIITNHDAQSDQLQVMTRGIRVIAGAAIGVVALGVAGGLYLKSRLPHEVADPKGSTINATQLTLIKEPIACYALGAWDTSRSAVTTRVTIPKSEAYLGNSALMQKGKAIDRTCIKADGISFADATVNGKSIRYVNFKRSAFTREVRMANYPDTVITDQPKPGSQALEGAVKTASGIARLVCTAAAGILRQDKISAGGFTFTCDSLNRFNQVFELNAAKLRGVLVADTEKTIQQEGGQKGWPTLWPVFIDGYVSQAKAQAKGQTVDAATLIPRLVDDNGNQTNQPPTFTADPYQALVDLKVISPQAQDYVKYDKQVIPLQAKPERVLP